MTIIGTGIVFSGLGYNPVQVIIFAQVANGLLLPILAVFLIYAMNRRGAAGRAHHSIVQNILVGIVALVIIMIGLLTLNDNLSAFIEAIRSVF